MTQLTSSDRPGRTREGAAADAVVDGRIMGVRFRHTLGRRRVMRLRIATGAGVSVQVRLTRAGRELLLRSVGPLEPGARTVDVRLGSGLGAGRATLTLTFSDAAGASKTTVAAVTVPESHA